jgi:hypothetical protein
MRESYRILLKENKLGNSQNYLSLIFVGSDKALGKNYEQIKSSLETMLGRL